MAGEIQTVRVVSTDEASQGPFVVINADDFDPAVHRPYEASDTSEQAPPDGEAEPTSEQAPRRARKAKEA